jgi:hypothetical protein
VKTIFALTFLLLSLFASGQSRLVGPAGDDTFQQLAEITGTQAGAGFGDSVAVSGNTLVVGAPGAPDNFCDDCGAAYVYSAVNGDWANLTLVATLTPPVSQGPGGFGYPVVIDGDTIAVGGTLVTYVYVNPSGNASPAAELTRSTDGAINSIAIDGGTIVVGVDDFFGAPYAAAFVYVEPTNGWANMAQTAELVSRRATGDFFGASVGVSGRNIVVGAPTVQIGGVRQGAAYLFVEPVGGWSGIWGPTTTFQSSNGTRNAAFGASVSVSGETVAVGAPDEAAGSADNEGAVYMFTQPSTGWPKTMTETAELTPTAAKAGSELGSSVALNGKTLVAGAPYEHTYQGFVYAFSEPSGGWQDGTQAEQIAAADGAANDYFGYSVSLSGGTITVGAVGWPGTGTILNGDGAAYVFGESQ